MNNPVEDYIDELELCRRTFGTIKQTNQVLKNFRKICNGKGILRVNEDDIKAFIRNMRDQKFADRTIKEYVSTLDRFYDFAVESKKYRVKINPVKRINKKLSNKRHQTKRPIKSLDEITELIKNVHNQRDRAIIVLLAKTAIRNGELVALNEEDVDFKNETLSVNKHVENHINNAIAPGRKNGNETVIPLDDETTRTLKFYLVTRQKTEDSALFISNFGKRLYPTDIDRIVKEWSIKTGVGSNSNDTDKKIVPHFFRAWTTYMLQINGCNPAVIDAIRGDVASTIRAFYVNQVLPFEVIRKEYLKAVPKFGI